MTDHTRLPGTAVEDSVVLVEQRGAVRIITLNRPQVLNALNAELELALWRALADADADPATRAVVLRGNGRAFCAGADLTERAAAAASDVDEIVREFRVHSAFMRVIEMDTPVVAAVHGYCLGGAFQLVGLCDITVLADTAKLGEPEVRFANPLLIPITPHLVGAKHARRLLYLGAMIDAHEARDLGLASEVVPEDALLERAIQIAEDIAAVPVAAVQVASRAVRLASSSRGLERESIVNAEILALTLQAQRVDEEGTAFLESVRTTGAGKAVSSVSSAAAARTSTTRDRSPGDTPSNGADVPMTDELDKRWEFVRIERMGTSAVITLDRPSVLNAMNRQLLRDFDDAFERAIGDEASRSVIIRGEGRAFSAGMDLKEPDLLPLPADGQRTHLAGLLRRTLRIWEADKPVIAAVHGHCLGHACDLAAAADFTIAAQSAQFGVPEVRHLGGVAAMLYPYLMPQKLVRSFLYRGRSLGAEEAMQAGLVTSVVPDDALLESALALGEELAAIPMAGLRQMKRAVNRSVDGMGLRATLAYNLESLALVLNAQPAQELARREEQISRSGLDAFLRERDQHDRPHEGDVNRD